MWYTILVPCCYEYIVAFASSVIGNYICECQKGIWKLCASPFPYITTSLQNVSSSLGLRSAMLIVSSSVTHFFVAITHSCRRLQWCRLRFSIRHKKHNINILYVSPFFQLKIFIRLVFHFGNIKNGIVAEIFQIKASRFWLGLSPHRLSGVFVSANKAAHWLGLISVKEKIIARWLLSSASFCLFYQWYFLCMLIFDISYILSMICSVSLIIDSVLVFKERMAVNREDHFICRFLLPLPQSVGWFQREPSFSF